MIGNRSEIRVQCLIDPDNERDACHGIFVQYALVGGRLPCVKRG
jgi:hypothetical protein